MYGKRNEGGPRQGRNLCDPGHSNRWSNSVSPDSLVGVERGSKLPSRSHGTSISNAPVSRPLPFRRLGCTGEGVSPGSWPRCPVNSALSIRCIGTRSSPCITTPGRSSGCSQSFSRRSRHGHARAGAGSVFLSAYLAGRLVGRRRRGDRTDRRLPAVMPGCSTFPRHRQKSTSTATPVSFARATTAEATARSCRPTPVPSKRVISSSLLRPG